MLVKSKETFIAKKKKEKQRNPPAKGWFSKSCLEINVNYTADKKAKTLTNKSNEVLVAHFRPFILKTPTSLWFDTYSLCFLLDDHH